MTPSNTARLDRPAPAAPAEDYAVALYDAYERATVHAADAPGELAVVRKAFRRAIRALEGGDPRPAVLLVYRW